MVVDDTAKVAAGEMFADPVPALITALKTISDVRRALRVPDGENLVDYAATTHQRLLVRVGEAEDYIETLERDLVRAKGKAEQYEKDWYAAKSEFGDAMAKANQMHDAEVEALKTALRSALEFLEELSQPDNADVEVQGFDVETHLEVLKKALTT